MFRRRFTAALLILFFIGLHNGAGTAAPSTPAHLFLARIRRQLSDLEIRGLVPGLPTQGSRYLSRDQLLRLTQVTASVGDDPNLVSPGQKPVQISGIPLRELRNALDVDEISDLINAACTDGYEAHYPSEYMRAHEPILALTINGLTPSEWSHGHAGSDPGPYLITHPVFRPAYSVLAHHDKAQIPIGVVRIEFTTQARAFGLIAPRGPRALEPDVQAGFAIARQNCLRCHGASGADGRRIGGIKAQRSWWLLAQFAKDDPVDFADLVRNPKSVNPSASMPGNPEYDGPTLAALTSYFQVFARN